MTLTLDLTPEQTARLQAEAAQRKLSLDEYVRRRLFDEPIPLAINHEERLAAIDRAMGALTGTGISSEEFMREKHAETEREEIRWNQSTLIERQTIMMPRGATRPR